MLRAQGYDAVHASEVGLESATDKVLWEYAKTHDAIIVTKDTDFLRLNISEPGPRVILVCTGNCSNRILLEKFFARLPEIRAHFDSGNRLVELR